MDVEHIKSPTKKQQRILHVTIFIGVCSMLFFLYGVTNSAVISNPILYGMLIFTFIFTCLKVLYEWCHYLHITVPETPKVERLYTVDMFTTYCKGEPYEMIVETLTALQAITYPHNTYLCDEEDDAYLKNICKQLGVHHITRTDKKNAKAGNINNALKHSNGELCVVLDPDHVPQPNFLDPIVSHFNDPKVGFVQIVQAYENHRETLIAKGAAQQTFHFYGPMMMTMNKYGTVLAIGANCTFRRAALNSIGGHAAGLAEDMHTAMQLHAKGWKSVYVPRVLARGFVPATLLSYYKQQLKWSRGVFELFVTSYIDLFKNFTWRQKLHYGLIPMYYLSGLVFMINFLIPIISLFTDMYPLKMDLYLFFVLSAPLVVSILVIRNYVQEWVMEDTERGFHVVGGLLLIGSWWVFNLGLLYTIIRKDVPYIPTPKDNKDQNSWLINLPNIVVLVLSVLAIAYGLYNDWNPFTFMMVGMASVNCLFMIFTLLAGVQLQFREFKARHLLLYKMLNRVSNFKGHFWIFRRRVYSLFRRSALIITILTVSICAYLIAIPRGIDTEQQSIDLRQPIFLSGIYSPDGPNGLTSLKQVNLYQSTLKTHFDIISFYVAWGDRPECGLPVAKIDSVLKNNSIPMITWEPWQSLFKESVINKETLDEKKVFLRIAQGKYDAYIKQFAQQVKSLRHPVFLRFAHETDNPAYPWSAAGNNTPEEFKAAWIHVHDIFTRSKASNVIWVWNPWRANAFKKYFPGVDYVDWLGVTILNYGEKTNSGGNSFKELYTPFHHIFKSYDLPVMVAEIGSLKSSGHQGEWLANSFRTIKNQYKEVKGFVLFNSSTDKNLPDGSIGLLDWTIGSSSSALPKQHSRRIFKPIDLNLNYPEDTLLRKSNTYYFPNLQGVHYDNAQYWHSNTNPLTKSGIVADFKQMKQAGINAVRVYGPNIYDGIIFNVAKQTSIKVQYGFWISDNLNFKKDTDILAKLRTEIIETVKKNKANSGIFSWHLGNNVIQKLSNYFYKPDLFYQQDAYLTWLNQLVKSIKAIDPKRPVTVDVMASKSLNFYSTLIHDRIPQINSIGLIYPEATFDTNQISMFNTPYFISEVAPESYLKLAPNNIGAFVGSWRDQHTADILTFSGLKDEFGRNKPYLDRLSNRWGGEVEKSLLPKIKILRPAQSTVYNAQLYYYALVDKNGKWEMGNTAGKGLTFEWYLIKFNEKGTAIYEKSLGKGYYKLVRMPKDVSSCKLYLIASKGKNVITTTSLLNIPL
jgi:cellulose synthase (UDP-forming)